MAVIAAEVTAVMPVASAADVAAVVVAKRK
jgi:hypothetical protein